MVFAVYIPVLIVMPTHIIYDTSSMSISFSHVRKYLFELENEKIYFDIATKPEVRLDAPDVSV